MKNLYTLLLLLLPLSFFAQSVTWDETNSQVYENITCPTPVYGNFYFQGNATGLVPGTDSVDIYIDFGDGNDSLRRYPVYNCGLWQCFYSSINHPYTTPGIYTVTAIVTYSSTVADTMVKPNSIVVSNTCNNVTGHLYKDNNSNCVFDAGDDPAAYSYVRFKVANGNAYWTVYTDANGMYQGSVFTGGTYEASPYFYYAMPHLGCSLPDTITFTSTGSDVVDFPLLADTIVTATSLTDSIGPVCYGTGNVNLAGSAGYFGDVNATSVQIYVAFGDGNDTTFNSPLYSFSPAFAKLTNFYLQHHYPAAGNYSPMLIVTDLASGATDTLVSWNDVTLSDSCGTITGNIYEDMNTNCSWDAGDDTVRYAWVALYQNSQFYTADYSDLNGNYAFNVPAGSYSLQFNNYPSAYGYSMTCSSSATRSVTLPPNGSVTEDFGIVCNNSQSEASTLLYGWGFRPGLDATLYPIIEMHSCIPQSGTATIVLDPLTTFVAGCDSTIAYTVSGNTVTWSYSNLSPQQFYWYWNHFWSCMTVHVDTSANVGDSLCFTFYISPSPADANPSNDTVHACFPVRNSWDPNYKEVSPNGVNANGHVAPNSEMTYTIHFQNTGNDVAYNIAIMDTIDPSLDLSTLQIIGASHPVDPDIIGNNIVRFNFNNINLPDSASDESNSHGWVSYRIMQKQWLPDATQIHNTAYIYFDFNPAIITNTTNTIVDWTMSINDVAVTSEVDVFPVPASDYVKVSTEKLFDGIITLRDLSGRVVRTENVNGKSFNLFVGDLADGVYILNITHEGKTISRKIMVQH